MISQIRDKGGDMNILIVGAGALGSLIGARLSRTQRIRFAFQHKSRAHGSIRQDGLDIEELDGTVEQLSAHSLLRA